MTWTPRQLEFRERMNALLTEYVDALGPTGWVPDDDQAAPVPASENCVASGWMLLLTYVDMEADIEGGDTGHYTVRFDSGIPDVTRVGLLVTALDMVRAS